MMNEKNAVPDRDATFRGLNQVSTAANVLLYEAAEKGDVQGLELALEQGANPNYLAQKKEGRPSSLHATSQSSDECTKILLAHGAKIDTTLISNFDSPLHQACFVGQERTCRTLLEAEHSTDCHNSFGHTPLHKAAIGGSVAVVRLLLERGADVNARNNRGSTPLHVCSFLAKAGRDGNKNAAESDTCGDDDEGTASFSTNDNHIRVAALLIRGGSCLDAKDSNGHTGLHVASQRGCINMMRLLTDSGASMSIRTDVNDRGRGGRTAAEMAAFGGQESARRYLLELQQRRSGGEEVATGNVLAVVLKGIQGR